MTLHISKRMIVGTAVLISVGAIALTAFLLGRSSTPNDPASPSTASPGPALDCSKSAFEDATVGTSLESEARQIYNPPGELISRPAGFGIASLICADLDGDGIDEMVGGLAFGASYRTMLYGLFRAGPGRWELAFTRGGFIISDLDARSRGLAERISTYGVDDPLCCPSGSRINRILLRGAGVHVSHGGVSRDRGVAISETEGATGLGPLELRTAGPSQAAAAFGPPTSAISNDQESATPYLCDVAWGDLGISISFVNLGGGDACSQGLVQSFELEGLAAEQAEWRTTDGVHVGMSQEQLSRLYPVADGAPSSGRVPLIQRYSEIGGGGFQQLLVAKLQDDRVQKLSSFVGSAGE